MTGIVLRSQGLAPLDLDDWDGGIITTDVEVGGPQRREVSENRPTGDGTIDQTRFGGSRAVTLTVALAEGPRSLRDLVDRIDTFMVLDRRSEIEMTISGTTRTLKVAAMPRDTTWKEAGYTVTQLQWVSVGYPYWLGAEHGIVLTPQLPEEGITPPLTPPVMLPPGQPAQSGLATNAGSVDAHWVAEIQGPAGGVEISNLTTGETLALTGLTVGAGQVAVVDSLARTVTLDGERRFSALDPARSTWWTLPPGQSHVDVPAVSSSAPASVWFRWRDTFYT